MSTRKIATANPLNSPKSVKRIFKVQHTDEQMEDELYSIVDLGGCVETVIVNHKVYGRMEAKLHITSRRLAWEFLEDIRSGKSSPLKNITSNYHYHEVHADSEETLDMIENTESGKILHRTATLWSETSRYCPCRLQNRCRPV